MPDRSREKEISVVIPVYNEKESLLILFNEIIGVMNNLEKHYEILFVDDGSTDGSREILEQFLRDYPDTVEHIRLEKNTGLTAALDAGFKESSGSVIVTLDSDLQNDPRDIPLLLELLKECDVVCGWRYTRKDSFVKKMSSRIANLFRRLIIGDTLNDIGCTLKAYRRDAVKALRLYNGLHRFIPALLQADGYRIKEMKVNHRSRRFGKSKYNIRNRIFKALVDLWAVRWMMNRILRYEIEKR